MNKQSPLVGSGLFACFGVLLVGCGGSSSPSAPPATVPPTKIVFQPGTQVDPTPGTISADTAVKGTVIYAGVDQNELNAVWVGAHKFYLYTDLSQATLAGVNFDFAFGSTATGSFLWQYRTNYPVIPLVNDGISAISKTKNVFFDVLTDDNTGNQTADLVTVVGGKIQRKAYTLPAVDFTANGITGVAVNSSGTAILNVYSLSIFSGKVKKKSQLSRVVLRDRLALRKLTLSKRIEVMANRLKPSTSSSTSGYYFVSPKGSPISLALPSGAGSVFVNSINDFGFAVGEAFVGDPNNPNVVPYYWTPNGDAYPLNIPTDVTYGGALDINNYGSIVGVLGNDLSQYGVIWNTAASKPTNINTMLPSSSKLALYSADSIGTDFSIAAEGVANSNSSPFYFFGFQPE